MLELMPGVGTSVSGNTDPVAPDGRTTNVFPPPVGPRYDDPREPCVDTMFAYNTGFSPDVLNEKIDAEQTTNEIDGVEVDVHQVFAFSTGALPHGLNSTTFRGVFCDSGTNESELLTVAAPDDTEEHGEYTELDDLIVDAEAGEEDGESDARRSRAVGSAIGRLLLSRGMETTSAFIAAPAGGLLAGSLIAGRNYSEIPAVANWGLGITVLLFGSHFVYSIVNKNE